MKVLKKELKYTRSVLEKKQIQQELNILYKERKNGHKQYSIWYYNNI